jgi:hypothetical protein
MARILQNRSDCARDMVYGFLKDFLNMATEVRCHPVGIKNINVTACFSCLGEAKMRPSLKTAEEEVF